MAAATPEQVDLVVALRKLVASLPMFVQRVITGDIEPEDWHHLADVLGEASRLARNEAAPVIIIDQRD